MQYGTNPNNNDSDGDYILDGVEVLTNHTDPLDSSNEYSEAVVNCIMELSGMDTNDYMLLVMGSSTNILLTSSSSSSISESMKICSTNQQLNVKLSRNLEVQSNDSPILSDVTSRVYTMDPWVITCYGDNYPGYRPPLPYSLNSTITRNSGGGGGGGTSFHIPTMSVNIVSSYSDYYYYIMCGCNNLEDNLQVSAEVCIEGGNGLIGTPYIFNPEPITCTASGGGDSIFQQDSDVYTIDLGSTIIDFYNIYEYAYFTLNMGVDNLENFEEEGNYNYNISVDATAEKLGTDSDSVDVPVDIRYSHGSWSIESMLNPSNVINILNSTNASVGIEFSHSECANYDLNGTLDITPDGNMDIFTLDYISREIDVEESPYSTSEDFSVIGCSEERNDILVDIYFYGSESLWDWQALTTYALVVSNLTDSIGMFDGFGDADNDGTNNVNDLDNAGDFMPFLVKTHETATSAFFRFDFDDTKVRIWKKDGTMTRTNSTDSIQEGQCYAYSELFSEGAEQTFYVQGLEAGKHDIEVVYVLNGEDLWTESVSFSSFKVDLDYDLWWFNGENPANYHTDATLTANGLDTGYFYWNVTQGADKVELDGGAVGWCDSAWVTDDNTVAIRSKSASAAAETVTEDITVTLTYNGKIVGSYDLAIFTPHDIIHLSNNDVDHYSFGYSSFIHYRARDQFKRTLPYNIGLNEIWTSEIVSDYSGMTWRQFGAGGSVQNPANMKDKIDGEYSNRTPTPIKPSDNDPEASTAVCHWTGNWYIGSTTPGKGVRVKTTCTWQKYRGYARHE